MHVGHVLPFQKVLGMTYAAKTRQWKISSYADKHCWRDISWSVSEKHIFYHIFVYMIYVYLQHPGPDTLCIVKFTIYLWIGSSYAGKHCKCDTSWSASDKHNNISLQLIFCVTYLPECLHSSVTIYLRVGSCLATYYNFIQYVNICFIFIKFEHFQAFIFLWFPLYCDATHTRKCIGDDIVFEYLDIQNCLTSHISISYLCFDDVTHIWIFTAMPALCHLRRHIWWHFLDHHHRHHQHDCDFHLHHDCFVVQVCLTADQKFIAINWFKLGQTVFESQYEMSFSSF